MLFNAEKREHLAISTRKSDNTSPRVTMTGTPIPHVTSHKHLGANFNNTLSWHQHVDKVYTSCARRIGMIRRLRRKLHPVVLKRKFDITSPRVTMNGTPIPHVTSHKHLGVNFNNTLSWHQHVDKVHTSCARRIGMIRRLWRKLHPVVLKRIYFGSSTA